MGFSHILTNTLIFYRKVSHIVGKLCQIKYIRCKMCVLAVFTCVCAETCVGH